MSKNIDIFLGKMETILTRDLIIYILKIVYNSHNKKLICDQKEKKKNVISELNNMFNVYYNDDKIMIYKNKNNQIMLKNYVKNSSCYLYNMQQPPSSVPDDEENQLVLLDEPSRRNIKLYVIYM